jgi:hypothetical protein
MQFERDIKVRILNILKDGEKIRFHKAKIE